MLLYAFLYNLPVVAHWVNIKKLFIKKLRILISEFDFLWGGETKSHSDAQEDSWRQILDYFSQHLNGKLKLNNSVSQPASNL